ncbi:MAG TPA: patatin-like phospholipase family protein [Gemmataceae bacterium]|nr:patatin-like phospholipase family protein [Gemmataceae bacterium]
MTRGYYLRLALWAVLVTVALAAAGHWFFQIDPGRAGPEIQVEPGDDRFPVLARYINRPLAWAGRSWLFLAVTGFLVLSAWGAVGRPLGVFDLIYAESRGWQVANGLILGLTSGNALAVAYLAAPEAVPWPVSEDWTLFPVDRDRGGPGEADAVRRCGNFLTAAWLPVLVLIAAPWRPWPRGRAGGRFPGVSVGLALSVLAMAAIVLAGWLVLTRPGAAVDWRAWFALTPGAASGRIPPDQYPLHLIAAGFTVLPAVAILGHLAAALVGRTGSPVWVVCLSLWLFTAGYGFVGYHFAGIQTALVVLAAGVVLVANGRHPYKLGLPNMTPEYDAARAGRPAPLGVTESPAGGGRVPLLTANEVLGRFRDRWQRAHGPDTKPRLVVVCASGGGIRSAVWTAAVLDGLARRIGPTFADHVRLITGASGGMLAAALYAAGRVRPLRADRSAPCALSEDCLWPTWQALFFNDLPAAFAPFHRAHDRAWALEASWHRNTPGPAGSPMAATFADLFPAERDGLAPSVVYSPMFVEDGRRLLISNLCLADLASQSAPTVGAWADGKPCAPRMRVSQPAVEFFRLFPQAHARFRVSTAARLSASFPYVSPAVSLPTSPSRRVVDAGFYDNYGVGLAAGWLLRHREAVREHCGGVAVIEVRGFPLEEEKTGIPTGETEAGGGAGDALSSALAGVSTPAEALGVIRAAGAYYRNDQLLELLDAEFNAGGKAPFFVRTALECPGAGSLSWALTTRDRDEVVGRFDTPAGDLADGVRGPVLGLRAWFGTGGA